MTDLSSPLGKMVGPEASPQGFERRARAFVGMGGVILLPHQIEALSPPTRSEIEAAMNKAYPGASKSRRRENGADK